jgi:hypothetical protein
MLKTLVLVATLGGLATLPEPAAAAGYGPGDLRTTSSFGLQVVIQPAPKIVSHHRHGPWQLRPQPVRRFVPPRPVGHIWRPPAVRHYWHPAPRHFWHPAPRPGWQRPWQRPPHHVERRLHGSEPWRQSERQARGGFERHRGARDWHQGSGQHRTGRGRNRH